MAVKPVLNEIIIRGPKISAYFTIVHNLSGRTSRIVEIIILFNVFLRLSHWVRVLILWTSGVDGVFRFFLQTPPIPSILKPHRVLRRKDAIGNFNGLIEGV